jgi:hypothetical protein
VRTHLGVMPITLARGRTDVTDASPCEICGGSLTARQTHYCSPLCRSRAAQQQRKSCIVDGCESPYRKDERCNKHYREKHGVTTEGRRHYRLATCTICGTHWMAPPKAQASRFCSTLCYGFHQSGRWPSCPIPKRDLVAIASCGECGEPFPLFVPWQTLCSDRCRDRRKRRRDAQRRRVSRPSLVAGYCRACGAAFVDVWLAESSSITCSESCAKRVQRQRRRARQRDAYIENVSPAYVYRRDGWRCYLCGKRVKRDAQVPDPMAPTIDHVIPLSQGGTHELSNVRCAHFICNSIKGHRGGGEQLMLLG